jgi:hypothetical protein
MFIPPGTWSSYIKFETGSFNPPPTLKGPIGGDDINFNDIIFPDVNSGWLFAPSPAIPANVNPVILDWTKLANGNGSLDLSNLKITRNPALGGLNQLTIYWGGQFPGPIPTNGLSVWKIWQSMNNIAKENTLGFASRVSQEATFQNQFSNPNPGKVIGNGGGAVINVPINTTSVTSITGLRSLTELGNTPSGTGPSAQGYKLYARTDVRLRDGYVIFPTSSAVELQGPPPPPDFFFVPQGGQLDDDLVNDIILAPGEQLSFDVLIDTSGVSLPHNLSDYQDILVEWDYQYDPSELALISNSNPSNSIIGVNDSIVSTLIFNGVNPGVHPHDGISDFGITLKEVLYRSSVWGNYSALSQFPAPSKDALDNPGTNFNQVVEVQTEETPAPLPVLGALSTFGFSRKLRKRIKG